MTDAEIELLAKECAWDGSGVFPLGTVTPGTPEQRREHLYQLGWNDARRKLLDNEAIFWTWLRSLKEAELAALAPLLRDEEAWLRCDARGAVTIWLMGSDEELEEVKMSQVLRRAE